MELRRWKRDAIVIAEQVHLYIIYITLSLVITTPNLFTVLYLYYVA
jgi:hypothetical protein